MPRVAVVGIGRTGSKVLDLLHVEQIVGPFSSCQPVTADGLCSADVVVAFIPGPAVDAVAEQVLLAGKPFVCGATGHTWSPQTHNKLVEHGLSWITAPNFSMGMGLCHRLLEQVVTGLPLLEGVHLSLREIHHTGKRDAPSGSALQWQQILGGDVPIASERIGHVTGVHELVLEAAGEKVTIRHEGLDRIIYARGALWAAEQLVSGKISQPGLHKFDDIIKDRFGEGVDEITTAAETMDSHHHAIR